MALIWHLYGDFILIINIIVQTVWQNCRFFRQYIDSITAWLRCHSSETSWKETNVWRGKKPGAQAEMIKDLIALPKDADVVVIVKVSTALAEENKWISTITKGYAEKKERGKLSLLCLQNSMIRSSLTRLRKLIYCWSIITHNFLSGSPSPPLSFQCAVMQRYMV